MKNLSNGWRHITHTIHEARGLSLVELLVALAVLTIIIVPFFHLLMVNYTDIITAGNKSQVLFNMQNAMEDALDTSSASGVSHSVAIVFPGIAPIPISGKMITIYDTYYRGNNVESAKLIVVVP